MNRENAKISGPSPWRTQIVVNSERNETIARLEQAVMVLVLLAFSWPAMMAVHEMGHVLGAWATGGAVRRVVLHPLVISRTDVRPNPAPLVVVWAGPIVGVLLPLVLAGMAYCARLGWTYLIGFFAGFCLIANGAYIGVGVIDGVGDAGVMLRHGSPPWVLIVFGALCVSAGLWLWHVESRRLGFGHDAQPIDRRHLIGTTALTCLLYGLLLAMDLRA